jgi:hypothetical protein
VNTLSEEQLLDISQADIDSLKLLDLLREELAENIHKFNLRPVDCNDF